MWKHWVSRALAHHEPFKDFESASWFWNRLTLAFPQMVSAVLMPNHLHLILPKKENATRSLAGLLSAMSVQKGVNKLWQPIPTPTEIPDLFHLRRQLRYLALNPCRKKLCQDPLEWYWSSYRDWMGATANPNQTLKNLAETLNESPKTLRVRFHSYVSGDPSVSLSGTHVPKPAQPPIFAEHSITELLKASAAALRMLPSQVRKQGPLRKLFIHLSYRHGWHYPLVLARVCGVTINAVYQEIYKEQPPGIEAAELCLGDPRLRLFMNQHLEFLMEKKA